MLKWVLNNWKTEKIVKFRKLVRLNYVWTVWTEIITFMAALFHQYWPLLGLEPPRRPPPLPLLPMQPLMNIAPAALPAPRPQAPRAMALGRLHIPPPPPLTPLVAAPETHKGGAHCRAHLSRRCHAGLERHSLALVVVHGDHIFEDSGMKITLVVEIYVNNKV